VLDFITLTDLLIGGAIIVAAGLAIGLGRLIGRRRQERERDR